MQELRKFQRILVVEDNEPLRVAIARLVRSWGAQALEASCLAEATALLSPVPDLIIADVRLPDGSARTLFEEAAATWPHPSLVAISGRASPEEAFELAQIGVRAYLPKPVTLDEISRTVDRIRRQPRNLDPLFADAVGRTGMREMTERVRWTMLREALALSRGSRSTAARLLHVSRQAVQQRLRGAARRGTGDDGRRPTRS